MAAAGYPDRELSLARRARTVCAAAALAIVTALGVGWSTNLRAAEWTRVFQTPTTELVLVLSSPDDDHCWFITNFDRVYKTANGGHSWTTITTGEFVPSGLFVLDGSTAFKTSSNTVFRTTDGGNTWVSVFSGAGSGPPVVWMTTPTTGYLTYRGEIYRSTDSGGTWSRNGLTQPPSPITNGNGQGTICVAGENLWVALQEGGVALSTDGAHTWTVPQNDGLFFGGTVCMHFADGALGLAIQTSSPFIYVTTDGGNHWAETDNSMGFNQDVLAVGTRCWYIPNPGDHAFVKYSSDYGATWLEQLTDDFGFSVLDRSRSGHILWTGTAGGRIYTYANDETADVGSDPTLELVEPERLHVAPNPCGDRIELCATERGRYRILTVDGARAAGGEALGRRSIDTNALAPGVYFLELIDPEARGGARRTARFVRR